MNFNAMVLAAPVRRTILAAAVWLSLTEVGLAQSTVAVVVNQAKVEAKFVVTRDGVAAREYTLAAGERTQISAAGNARLVIGRGESAPTVALAGGMLYGLEQSRPGLWGIRELGRREAARPAVPKAFTPGGGPPTAPGAVEPLLPALPAPGGDAAKGRDKPAPLKIAVKVFVDEEEPATTMVWERRLRERFEAVSDVLEKTAGVRFSVTSTGTWRSNNRLTEFTESLREFEGLADPGQARLAIGFTSQYQTVLRRTHLGGTHGPLSKHILLREWSRHFSESERMEVLLHELGHFLGAVHSANGDSVMRPVLGDRKSRLTSFEVKFDDTNSKIIALVAGELRNRNIKRLADVSPATRDKLRAMYNELHAASPTDPAAAAMMRFLEAPAEGNSPTRPLDKR